jgi:hypothetical protein
MTILASIEAEFNAIVADVKSVPEKLEALVGLQSKAQALQALEASVTAIINGPDALDAKVEAILKAVGKL